MVAVALVGCMSPVVRFGEGKTAKEAQHDTLSDLLPARLSMEQSWTGPVHEAKIRVYADDEYRAQNVKWRDTFGNNLDYVNAVLGPQFGVRLAAEYREWAHHAPSSQLTQHLEALQALDSGTDVLAVIGLTSSLSLASATYDQLGLASLPGRHMVVRGYADLAERKAFASAFRDLSADEREHALEARRIHKGAAVLLHELGHNLAAQHDSTADMLMSSSYSAKAAAFGSDAHLIIQRTLDQRLGRASQERTPTPLQASATKQRTRLQVVLLANAVIVEGEEVDDGSLNVLFSEQAAIDSETEVVIKKDKGVPIARLTDLIERAKAQGLKNFAVH